VDWPQEKLCAIYNLLQETDSIHGVENIKSAFSQKDLIFAPPRIEQQGRNKGKYVALFFFSSFLFSLFLPLSPLVFLCFLLTYCRARAIPGAWLGVQQVIWEEAKEFTDFLFSVGVNYPGNYDLFVKKAAISGIYYAFF
jgi:hypothetical protein